MKADERNISPTAGNGTTGTGEVSIPEASPYSDTEYIFDHTPTAEAERLRQQLSDNMPNYHDDPDPDVLVDETPGRANGMFGDHEDDFDIG